MVVLDASWPTKASSHVGLRPYGLNEPKARWLLFNTSHLPGLKDAVATWLPVVLKKASSHGDALLLSS